MLDKEFKYFLSNQAQLVSQYEKKVLVIIGEKVVGVYDNFIDAYTNAQNKYDPGSFMIQLCEPGPEAHTLTISHI